jgi:hypothetical protein
MKSMLKLRQWALRQLIRFTERELYATPVLYKLDDERRTKLLATIWELPGFREYCIERETRFIHALATTWTPEVQGQRVENSLLFQKAHGAWKKLYPKEQETLATEDTRSAPRRKR